ncbi:MAG: DUF4031 domain-containing protein [Actinomycetota bacterium]|nr:DUF4031 domain-containing protein [Actinomycetota bacterium]
MAIYVDKPLWTFRGVRHAHMVSDQSYEELHRFAGALGFPLRAFQGDHYDIPEYLIDDAIALGAISVSPRELLSRLKSAGLRLKPKHRDG